MTYIYIYYGKENSNSLSQIASILRNTGFLTLAALTDLRLSAFQYTGGNVPRPRFKLHGTEDEGGAVSPFKVFEITVPQRTYPTGDVEITRSALFVFPNPDLLPDEMKRTLQCVLCNLTVVLKGAHIVYGLDFSAEDEEDEKGMWKQNGWKLILAKVDMPWASFFEALKRELRSFLNSTELSYLEKELHEFRLKIEDIMAETRKHLPGIDKFVIDTSVFLEDEEDEELEGVKKPMEGAVAIDITLKPSGDIPLDTALQYQDLLSEKLKELIDDLTSRIRLPRLSTSMKKFIDMLLGMTIKKILYEGLKCYFPTLPLLLPQGKGKNGSHLDFLQNFWGHIFETCISSRGLEEFILQCFDPGAPEIQFSP